MGEASRGRNRQTRKLDSSLGGHQDCGGGLEKGRVRSSRPGCTDRMDGQAHPTSQILGWLSRETCEAPGAKPTPVEHDKQCANGQTKIMRFPLGFRPMLCCTLASYWAAS